MNFLQSPLKIILLIGITTWLTACGGGSSGSGDSDQDDNPWANSSRIDFTAATNKNTGNEDGLLSDGDRYCITFTFVMDGVSTILAIENVLGTDPPWGDGFGGSYVIVRSETGAGDHDTFCVTYDSVTADIDVTLPQTLSFPLNSVITFDGISNSTDTIHFTIDDSAVAPTAAPIDPVTYRIFDTNPEDGVLDFSPLRAAVQMSFSERMSISGPDETNALLQLQLAVNVLFGSSAINIQVQTGDINFDLRPNFNGLPVPPGTVITIPATVTDVNGIAAGAPISFAIDVENPVAPTADPEIPVVYFPMGQNVEDDVFGAGAVIQVIFSEPMNVTDNDARDALFAVQKAADITFFNGNTKVSQASPRAFDITAQADVPLGPGKTLIVLGAVEDVNGIPAGADIVFDMDLESPAP